MCRIEAFIKSILILANISAMIAAIAYLTVGTMFHLPTMHSFYFLLLSALLPVTAILGCFSIWRESISLTTVYVILILCITIVDVMMIIPTDTKVDENIYANLKREIEKTWAKEIKQAGAIDKLQELYECCGKDSAEDYTKILHRHIPKSCYDSKYGTLYRTGCLESAEYYKTVGGLFTVLTWINLIIDIIWFAFACAMVTHFKKPELVIRRRIKNNKK